MSASRDKSQNIGFVYTNIYQLYKKSQNNAQAAASAAPKANPITSDSRVFRADELAEIKVTKFEPKTLARPVAAEPTRVAGNPFDDLKANMNKLQDLHSKLRFMLKELEDLVGKKD